MKDAGTWCYKAEKSCAQAQSRRAGREAGDPGRGGREPSLFLAGQPGEYSVSLLLKGREGMRPPGRPAWLWGREKRTRHRQRQHRGESGCETQRSPPQSPRPTSPLLLPQSSQSPDPGGRTACVDGVCVHVCSRPPSSAPTWPPRPPQGEDHQGLPRRAPLLVLRKAGTHSPGQAPR